MNAQATTTTAHPSLRGRTVLVTGALGGLGTAIVDAFAASEARVAVHHLGQAGEAAERVRRLTEAGTAAMAVEADITDWDAVEGMVARVGSELGPIDVLVNNAGYMAPGRLAEISLEEWRKTLTVDLDGVFLCSRHVLGSMLERGAGVIVNVSSQLAFKGARDYVSYCAAKAGVAGLTRALAREVGPAVRVNAIAPGPVDTPFITPWATEEWKRERTGDLVIGRLATPEEIAPTVAFLASDDAALYHGQVLHLNGGGVMA
ncbi:SDR family NAD(P)-dependent oxidoreductase [Streptosporangium amethystogenes]|uniref:SDR family NAD(P)-dependent oxidoreductase n=1 Tax=Streptosporangium amethystogenes TaxID=2002 RepID=UPI00068A26E6|nr:SDR family oxidoreductase [Streptosporangium amethystogenes]